MPSKNELPPGELLIKMLQKIAPLYQQFAENKNGERANIPQNLTARIIHVAISRVLYHKCCDRYYLNTCYGYFVNGWPKNEYKKTGWGYYETRGIVEEMGICKNRKISIIF